jgi:hypothetical protein
LRWRDIRPPRPKPTPPEAVVCVFIVTLLRITSAYRVSQRTVERTRGELRGPAKPDIPLSRDLHPSGAPLHQKVALELGQDG